MRDQGAGHPFNARSCDLLCKETESFSRQPAVAVPCYMCSIMAWDGRLAHAWSSRLWRLPCAGTDQYVAPIEEKAKK